MKDGTFKTCLFSEWEYLLWEDVIGRRKDVCDEGAIFDVFIIADDVHSIVTRLSGPVAHITGAITLIITFNSGLRRPFDGETCKPE